MNQPLPATVYQETISKHQQQLELLLRKRRTLGWLRFVVFILTIIGGWQLFVYAGPPALIFIIAGIAVLLYLVYKDADNNQSITNTKTLIAINQDELKVLDHNFYYRYDGHEHAPGDHDYANDLDLFGKASLYQWSNRCFTEQGRKRLSNDLLKPLSVPEITSRQEAVKELAHILEWRHQFQAFAMHTHITSDTETKTNDWLQADEKHFTGNYWPIIVQIYTLITISTAIFTILGWISFSQFAVLFMIYFFIAGYSSRSTIKSYKELSGIVKEISTLYDLINWIEKKSFHSTQLKDMQTELQKEKAAEEIKELKNILDRFDLRLNMAHPIFLNPFFLWDVRQMISLNQWRIRNNAHVSTWFEAIAEMEVLNSLSSIHFNNPEWSFPTFSEEYFKCEMLELGHPLIPAGSRVINDFVINGQGKIGLVTGSNMAGKSTFLRSIGVNIVLAQLGSVVCAEKLLVSPVRLMSSMRIADNLAENTSTFYAELKKLKSIIETVNHHEHVFILLDEILRGTNSLDRHTGSEALIKQLIKQKTVAIIATHDLELARLKDKFQNAIDIYHFDVQVNGEELYFDYKLKDGVCTSLNASILMKKIGIELEN
ncbi:MAG: MutS-related protein [Flavisolibacter sp.]